MELISELFIFCSIGAAALVALDLKKHRQSVPIMNIVWVITMLWGTFLAAIAYFGFGREKSELQGGVGAAEYTSWQNITISTLHCGAGCAIGDMIGEIFLYIFPYLSLYLGFYGVFGLDIILSLFFGVIFQYEAIRVVSNVPRAEALRQAIKSDFLSLLAWQVGKLIFAFLVIHNQDYSVNSTEFLFMMQIAMIIGFFFSYPVNWLLIKYKIKDH